MQRAHQTEVSATSALFLVDLQTLEGKASFFTAMILKNCESWGFVLFCFLALRATGGCRLVIQRCQLSACFALWAHQALSLTLCKVRDSSVQGGNEWSTPAICLNDRGRNREKHCLNRPSKKLSMWLKCCCPHHSLTFALAVWVLVQAAARARGSSQPDAP